MISTFGSASGTIRAESAPAARAHVVNEFHFIAKGPYASVAPLFGASGERAWAGADWQPAFVYPLPEQDVPGAVFTVQTPTHAATWVTTRFDLAARQIQHVFFIPDAMVVVIDVHLVPIDESNTRVSVTYQRTALNRAADDHVRELGEHDAAKASDWEQKINEHLRTAGR